MTTLLWAIDRKLSPNASVKDVIKAVREWTKDLPKDQQDEYVKIAVRYHAGSKAARELKL